MCISCTFYGKPLHYKGEQKEWGINMIKYVYKTIILLFLFFGALFLFSRNMETDMEEKEEEIIMTEETYPYIRIQTQGKVTNTLYGYNDSFEPNTVRESVTPLDATKKITLLLSEAKSRLIHLEYKVIDKETGEVYSTQSVNAIPAGQKQVELTFDYGLKTSTEYILDIKATSDKGKVIHYYTRLKYYLDDSHLSQKLAFAKKFHRDTFVKGKGEELARYLEPSASNANNSLAHVDITSNSDLITWSGMAPKVVSEELLTIKEYNMETACIQYNYFVQAATTSGKETYHIKEFYRVRNANGQNYLLNFERSMESIFDPQVSSIKSGQLKVGITDEKSGKMLTTKKENKLFFVRNGNLFQYDMESCQVTKIFTAFSDKASYAYRGYNEQAIRLLKVDDKDNLYFCAYGYFPRGRYEGDVAVVLFEYTAEGQLQELVYMPMSTTFQQLHADFEEYGYVSARGIYYFTVANTVYAYNMSARRLEKIAENVKQNSFMTMEAANCYAWSSSLSTGYGESITIYNLEKDEKKLLYSPDNNSYIRLLGVIEDNMIYGYVRKSDMGKMEDGTSVVPCYELDIVNSDGKILRKYTKKNAWIQKIVSNGNVINMTLCRKKGNGMYEKAGEDTILNNNQKKATGISYASRVTTKCLTEWYIQFSANYEMKQQPKWGDEVNRLKTSDKYVRLEQPQIAKYYVYAAGKIVASYESPAKAIRLADERMGVVVSSNHQLVWERSGAFLQNTIGGLEKMRQTGDDTNLATCVRILLKANHYDVDVSDIRKQGDLPYQMLSKYLQRPMYLKGCTLEEVLYFVSGNKPVIAMTSNKKAVVIGGYTGSKLTIYNPETGKEETVSRSQYEKIFKKAGNHFVSYMVE